MSNGIILNGGVDDFNKEKKGDTRRDTRRDTRNWGEAATKFREA